MFENVDLILRKESKELFDIQQDLIKKFKENNSENTLIQISLLHTLVPLCDNFTALNVLKCFRCKEFDAVIIGAYLCAECLDIEDNSFLDELFFKYESFNSFEKSLIKYVQALYTQNHNLMTKDETLKIITESISLCDKYVSNYYFRYLITQNNLDLVKAKKNLKKISTNCEIKAMTIYEFINPTKFIEEKILMNFIPEEVNNAIFEEYSQKEDTGRRTGDGSKPLKKSDF